jgi:hypothetical protein
MISPRNLELEVHCGSFERWVDNDADGRKPILPERLLRVLQV